MNAEEKYERSFISTFGICISQNKEKEKQKITKESLQVGSRMAENPIAEPTCLLFSPARQAMGPHFNMEHKMEGNP